MSLSSRSKFYYVELRDLELEHTDDSVQGRTHSYIELMIEMASHQSLHRHDPIIAEKAREYAWEAWGKRLTRFSVSELELEVSDEPQ